MRPIKSVFTACEGSEKQYSVNGSESTQMLVGRERSWKSGDETPVMQAILNRFNFVPKAHHS